MSSEHDAGRPWEESKRRLVPATVVGGMIEWYDIAIYAQASALVFGRLFFPALSPGTATLASLATFGAGFAARPVGALVLGPLGDRYGRKFVLVATILMMGIATTLIGALPTYAAIGVWAPALLVFLRFVQGLGVGSEYAGAVTLLAEYAPARRRGFFSAVPAAGLLLGIGGAAAVSAALTALPEDALLSWGWRLPFLLSITLVGVGLFVRLRVLESPVFTSTGARRKLPLVEAVRGAPRRLALATTTNGHVTFASQILQVFVLAYLAQRGVRASTGLIGLILAAVVGSAAVLAVATAGDRLGRRPVYLGTQVAMALTPFPLFLLLDTGRPVLIWLGMVATFGAIAASIGVQAAYLAELFSTRYRVTGYALAREIPTGLLGAPAPLIAAALTAAAGGRPWPTAALMTVVGCAGVAAAARLPETRGADMSR
ncbi:MFS transporter [Micromonospora sp. NPDC049559]|uniref:MFS transporter n=1 Tax=Micromonospora sp. NPDC049559 TaxID=3155923 RepID=UPI003421A4AA